MIPPNQNADQASDATSAPTGTVAIIITTRDRAHDLTQTLENLLQLGLADLPLYIIDDASEEPIANLPVLKRFPNCTVRRNAVCRGLIINRNTLAEIASEEVLISLDDDSCFVHRPDLNRLVERFRGRPDLCAVEFDNFETPNAKGTAVSDQQAVQMFTGFGHAIHRDRFLRLSGYRGFLFHMCEEREFGRRAWKHGYRVEKYRDISVLHRRTPVARMHDRNVYYLARNTLFLNVATFGIFGAISLPLAAAVMLTVWPQTKGRRRIAARAIVGAIRLLIAERASIDPLSLRQIRAFRALPVR